MEGEDQLLLVVLRPPQVLAEVWSMAIYGNAKFYTRRSRPMSDFSYLKDFVVQTLFLDLKVK